MILTIKRIQYLVQNIIKTKPIDPDVTYQSTRHNNSEDPMSPKHSKSLLIFIICTLPTQGNIIDKRGEILNHTEICITVYKYNDQYCIIFTHLYQHNNHQQLQELPIYINTINHQNDHTNADNTWQMKFNAMRHSTGLNAYAVPTHVNKQVHNSFLIHHRI